MTCLTPFPAVTERQAHPFGKDRTDTEKAVANELFSSAAARFFVDERPQVGLVFYFLILSLFFA